MPASGEAPPAHVPTRGLHSADADYPELEPTMTAGAALSHSAAETSHSARGSLSPLSLRRTKPGPRGFRHPRPPPAACPPPVARWRTAGRASAVGRPRNRDRFETCQLVGSVHKPGVPGGWTAPGVVPDHQPRAPRIPAIAAGTWRSARCRPAAAVPLPGWPGRSPELPGQVAGALDEVVVVRPIRHGTELRHCTSRTHGSHWRRSNPEFARQFMRGTVIARVQRVIDRLQRRCRRRPR